MSVATGTKVQEALLITRTFSEPERTRFAALFNRQENEPLPENISIDEAIELYLADACNVGRAAELAGVTRWDVMDRMKERGITTPVPDLETVEEMDALAAELEREGYF